MNSQCLSWGTGRRRVFTPPSLVQLIVNFIEPDKGIIHDPACGSGGMFIQTAYFINQKKKKVFNQ